MASVGKRRNNRVVGGRRLGSIASAMAVATSSLPAALPEDPTVLPPAPADVPDGSAASAPPTAMPDDFAASRRRTSQSSGDGLT